MSFATTASTSRSPWRTRSRPPRPRPMRFASTYAKEKPNVETDLEADDEPDVVATTFGPRQPPAKRARRCRGRVRERAGQARPDLCHAGRDAQPIELHATTAIWDGSTLTLYESSQGVVNLRGVLAQMFGLPKENVRVITKFVGSGFGGKLWPWTHCPLAAAAARQLGKPVKLVRQPQDDVPDGRSSPAHPAARAARRDAGRQARLAPARLRLPHVDARRLPRRLRRGDAVPVQRAQPARDLRPRQAQRRRSRPTCAAPAPCPGSTRPSRR